MKEVPAPIHIDLRNNHGDRRNQPYGRRAADAISAGYQQVAVSIGRRSTDRIPIDSMFGHTWDRRLATEK